MTARFITVEGGEGVGKSSNMAFVCDWLRARGHRVERTREPGGTPVGERIRDVLLAQSEAPMPADCELLLMFAARAAHLRQCIEPALAAGRFVVCDRFTDASYAYQGGGRGIDAGRIEVLETLVQGETRPGLTLLLDAPVETGMARARARGAADRFEAEAVAFFHRVRDAYLARAAAEPARIRIVDASQPLPGVQRDIERILHQYLEEISLKADK